MSGMTRPRKSLRLRGGSDSETRSSRTPSPTLRSRTASNFSSYLGDGGWSILTHNEIDSSDQRIQSLISLRDAVTSNKRWRSWMSKPVVKHALAQVSIFLCLHALYARIYAYACNSRIRSRTHSHAPKRCTRMNTCIRTQ
jgi:hypothetical protein